MSLAVVIGNILIRHFLAPYGMFFAPAAIVIVASFIAFISSELKSMGKCIIVVGLISFLDIGTKLFHGGDHDLMGQALFQLALFMGLVPAFLILIIGIFNSTEDSRKNKWISIVAFPIITYIEFLIFQDLGRGRSFSYPWNE